MANLQLRPNYVFTQYPANSGIPKTHAPQPSPKLSLCPRPCLPSLYKTCPRAARLCCHRRSLGQEDVESRKAVGLLRCKAEMSLNPLIPYPSGEESWWHGSAFRSEPPRRPPIECRVHLNCIHRLSQVYVKQRHPLVPAKTLHQLAHRTCQCTIPPNLRGFIICQGFLLQKGKWEATGKPLGRRPLQDFHTLLAEVVTDLVGLRQSQKITNRPSEVTSPLAPNSLNLDSAKGKEV